MYRCPEYMMRGAVAPAVATDAGAGAGAQRVTRARARQHTGEAPTYRGAAGFCLSQAALDAIRAEAEAEAAAERAAAARTLHLKAPPSPSAVPKAPAGRPVRPSEASDALTSMPADFRLSMDSLLPASAASTPPRSGRSSASSAMGERKSLPELLRQVAAGMTPRDE